MVASEHPDVALIQHPESWPLRPLLPLRRRDASQPLGYELGVLLAPRQGDDTLVVIHAELSELCRAKREDRLEELPCDVYPTVGALLADRWVVD